MANRTDKFEKLRQEAEKFLSQVPQETQKRTAENFQRLLEDLHVHQIELSMQNDELLKAQIELEESRTRYFELYDFAPVGYFSIKQNGEIIEVNLASAQLLGIERRYLLKRKLSDLIPFESQGLFSDHCRQVIKTGEKQTCELEFKKKDGNVIYVQLQSIVCPDNNELTKQIQIAVMDITDRKRVEKELAKHRHYLEKLVEERTFELTKTNKNLKGEINQREQAEEALQNALNKVKQLKNRLYEENIYLKDEIKLQYGFEEIIGQSSALSKILSNLERVASTGSTVLILGETGTGKELIARAIHNLSRRKDKTMVKFNCAAIPANLIESELFGYEKGAFTGALTNKTGRFELADKGTIFLDEIGDLPLDLQAKLLRVLQEGEFERLGNPKTIKVNVRVIAATNHDLEKAMEQGAFRQDLYYRLNVFPITMPPLRERKDDIPALVNHFVKKYNLKMGKEINTLPLGAMDALQNYTWPGNVRELENVIERAVILSEGNTLQIDEVLGHPCLRLSQKVEPITLKENERALIIKTLKESDWVIEGKSGAAAHLGAIPSTLRYRMKILGINRPPSQN